MVFFHGHVSETARRAFVQGCSVFVASAMYEGFGLPLFEALQAGKACIYHGQSAASEFAADCALATDCARPEVLAGAMETLAGDDTLRREYADKARMTFAARWRDYRPGPALRQALLPLLA